MAWIRESVKFGRNPNFALLTVGPEITKIEKATV